MTQRRDDQGRERPPHCERTLRSLREREANDPSRPSASPETTLRADLDSAHTLRERLGQIDDVSAQHAIEERYQTLFQQSKDAIFLMNGSAFVDCNESTLTMFGCEYHEIIGRAPYCFSPLEQRDGSDSKTTALELMTAAYDGQPQRFEWLHCRLDGSLFDAEVSLNRLQLSEGTMLLAIVRDITERRAREMERQRYQDDLRDFAARLAHAGDIERRRLAADLHDSAGQNLSAALLRLRQARAHATQPSQLEQLQVAQELVQRTSDQLRSMSLQLAPPVLHEVGLRAALDGAARRFEEEWGVACQVLGEQPLDPLPLEVRTTLYRCICELLANVAKHARASRVRLTWQGCNDATTLWVTDDGCGFDEANARRGSRAPGGFGLFSVRERMRSIGGGMEVGSTLGKGTSIALRWTVQDRP